MLNVIVDETVDPPRNLALDEALLRARSPAPRPSPLLRIWQTAPSVMLGRFQNVVRSVDLAACARDGVQIVRRATGGGAVFTDPGTLCFTLVHHQDLRRTRPRPARSRYPRPAARPDLDTLVAAAVEEFGLPGAPLRDGTLIQSAWLRTRSASLTHVAVQVMRVAAYGRGYIEPPGVSPLAPGGGLGARRTLADFEQEVTLDAVRAAVLSVVADEYGIVRTRRPDASERAARDHLQAVRYGDVTWHLAGSYGLRHGTRALPDAGPRRFR